MTNEASAETGNGQASEGQHHSLAIYFQIWGYLFLLSALSYMVDIMALQGLLRWTLIVIFMLLKAGLIMAVFMHMMWERLSLIYSIMIPPIVIFVLVAFTLIEADYTAWTRILFLGE